MHKLKEILKEKLLTAAIDAAPHIEQLSTRPVFLLATASAYGAPRWDSTQFLSHARQYSHAVALDFYCGLNVSGWAR